MLTTIDASMRILNQASLGRIEKSQTGEEKDSSGGQERPRLSASAWSKKVGNFDLESVHFRSSVVHNFSTLVIRQTVKAFGYNFL